MIQMRMFVLIAVMLTFVGCSTKKTVIVDPQADAGPQTMALDYRDFEKAANDSVQDLILSGAVNRPGGGRYVMVVSTVINDTMQRIDTDLLTKKIRVALLRSGKVVTTTAVGNNGPEDSMSMQARKLRQSEEFNQNTVAKKGQMIAPELSLSGKIIQRNLRTDDNLQQVEYYFLLSMTDINSGLAFWENETPIIKRGDTKSVSW
jgi:hypothetical protein